MPVPPKTCVSHIDPKKWRDEVTEASKTSKTIRTTCGVCGKFIGYRTEAVKP